MDGFETFEPALRKGLISVEPCLTDPALFLHEDEQDGHPRRTYVRFEGTKVTAMAMICPAPNYEGHRCFQVAYAVPEHLRRQGRAKEVLRATLKDFQAYVEDSGGRVYYIEAMIGAENLASQRVAEAVIVGRPIQTVEKHSGKPAVQYLMRVEIDA